VLVLGGGGAFFFIRKQHAAAEDGEEAAPPPKAAAMQHLNTHRVYLPMDSMVVNLADPGGETCCSDRHHSEVIDAKASDSVKAYLPTIRSSVLMLISSGPPTSCSRQKVKRKLVEDILKAASVPFGGGEEEEESTSKKKRRKWCMWSTLSPAFCFRVLSFSKGTVGLP